MAGVITPFTLHVFMACTMQIYHYLCLFIC